jgi:hypothetical protein
MSSFSPLQPPNVTYAGLKPLFLNVNNISGDTQYTQALSMGNDVAIVFQPTTSGLNGRYGITGSTQLTPIDSLFDITVPGMTPTGICIAIYLNSGVPIDPFAPLENTITTITPGVDKVTIFVGIRAINPGDVITWFCPRLSTAPPVP